MTVGRIQFFDVVDRQLAVAKQRRVAIRVLDIGKPLHTQVRVRARPSTPPVAIAPVDQVVLAFAAWSRPIRDLVPVHARGGQALGDHFVTGGHDFFLRCRDLAATNLARHGSPVFHDQRIGRNMVDVGFDHAIQGVGDVVVSLGRGGIDHVQVDVVETSRAGLTSCREGAAGGVRTLQHAQHILRSGLHAQRHAVVAGFTDASEKLG